MQLMSSRPLRRRHAYGHWLAGPEENAAIGLRLE